MGTTGWYIGETLGVDCSAKSIYLIQLSRSKDHIGEKWEVSHGYRLRKAIMDVKHCFIERETMFKKGNSGYEKEIFDAGMYPVVVEDLEEYEFENKRTGSMEKRIGWKLRVRDGHPRAGSLMETSSPVDVTERNRTGLLLKAILGSLPEDPDSLKPNQIIGQKLHVYWDMSVYEGTHYWAPTFALKQGDDLDGESAKVPDEDDEMSDLPF